jgi:hypothetical protein
VTRLTVASLTATSMFMGGLAMTATGAAQAVVPDRWGFASYG